MKSTIPNVTFKRTVTAQLNLTSGQWELYCSMPGVEDAALVMNRQLERAIGMASSSGEALKLFSPTLKAFSQFGATDSEPQWVAERICREAFGEESFT